MSVAGHSFNLSDVCECGKQWRDVEFAYTEDYVGVKGIAHYGELTSTEVQEIARERIRRSDIMAEATNLVHRH